MSSIIYVAPVFRRGHEVLCLVPYGPFCSGQLLSKTFPDGQTFSDEEALNLSCELMGSHLTDDEMEMLADCELTHYKTKKNDEVEVHVFSFVVVTEETLRRMTMPPSFDVDQRFIVKGLEEATDYCESPASRFCRRSLYQSGITRLPPKKSFGCQGKVVDTRCCCHDFVVGTDGELIPTRSMKSLGLAHYMREI